MQVQIYDQGAAMPPKPGYKQPGRDGKVSILIHLDDDVRTAFKVAAIENGTTMQAVLADFIETYSATALKRQKRQQG